MNTNPKEYSKHSYFQKSDNLFVLNKYFHLINWKNSRNTVLDIGSGEGYTTTEILLPIIKNELSKNMENNLKIIGSDISFDMVQFANKMNLHRIVNFIQLNIQCEHLPENLENNFDHIFSFYCFHWVQNQRKAFQNIHKMLRPGGDILLSFLTTHPLYDVYESMGSNIRWAKYHKQEYISPYHRCLNPEEKIEKLLRANGFERVKCKAEERCFVFQSWDRLIKSVIAVNPVIPQLTRSDKEKYIADFIKTTKALLGCDLDSNNNEEPVPTRYKLMVVYAAKSEK